MPDYVIRSPGSARASLNFSWNNGALSLPGSPAQPLRVLRRDANGALTALWGERVVSGILTRGTERGDVLQLSVDGDTIDLVLREAMLDAMEQNLSSSAPNGGKLELKSPIPGLVKNVLVRAGDRVSSGQNLIVLEAMKMENEIAAVHDGIVESIDVKPGQAVAAGALLAVLRLG